MAVASKTYGLLGVFLFLFIATAVSVNAQTVNETGLMAAYVLNSSWAGQDATGQYGNLTIGAGCNYTNIKFGYGVYCSGASGALTLPSNLRDAINGKSTISIIAWAIQNGTGSRSWNLMTGDGTAEHYRTTGDGSTFVGTIRTTRNGPLGITHDMYRVHMWSVVLGGGRYVWYYNTTAWHNESYASAASLPGTATFGNGAGGADNRVSFSQILIYNRTLTSNEIATLFNNGTGAQYFRVSNFTVQLIDGYTNGAVSTFNLTLSFANGTNQNYSTTTGTITTSVYNDFTQLVNLSVYGGGYHTISYSNYNVSGNLVALSTQIFLNITAFNALTNDSISSFNISTLYKNYTTSSGGVLANLTNGTAHNITIRANGYVTQTNQVQYSTSPSNQTLAFYLYPSLTVRLFNETDGSAFNPNITTSTILRSFCSNTTQQQSLTTSNNNFNATCAWDIMRVYVTFGNDTYYRTLKPTLNSTTIDFYLINLNTDTAVQKTFTLNDLSGTYGNGDLIFDKIIGTNQVTINQDAWDIENKVISYFILFDNYIVEITDNDDTTRVLGPFIADTTSSHVLTVPNIPFYGDNEIDDFQWGYLFDNQGQWLYMNYQNEEGTLTSVTYAIVNASNTSQVFYNNTFNTSSGSVNFTSISNGTMYKTLLTFNHSSWSVHTDIKTWGAIGLVLDTLEGFTPEEQYWIKSLLAVAIIIIVIFVFSGLTISAGILAGTAFTTFFYWIHWLPISTLLMTVIGLIAIMGVLLAEGVR